ncbi:MAG: hypothetical protein ACOCRK_02925 [bacterium]
MEKKEKIVLCCVEFKERYSGSFGMAVPENATDEEMRKIFFDKYIDRRINNKGSFLRDNLHKRDVELMGVDDIHVRFIKNKEKYHTKEESGSKNRSGARNEKPYPLEHMMVEILEKENINFEKVIKELSSLATNMINYSARLSNEINKIKLNIKEFKTTIPTYNQTGLVGELLSKGVLSKDNIVNYNDYDKTIWHWNTVPYPFSVFLKHKGEMVLTAFSEDIWWGRKKDIPFKDEPLIEEYFNTNFECEIGFSDSDNDDLETIILTGYKIQEISKKNTVIDKPIRWDTMRIEEV